MIEFTGQVNPILRIAERQSALQGRREAALENKARTSQAASAAHSLAASEEGPGVVNFEYVPSGRVQLNQQERQHLIDFFE
ncbi:MAG TPA: hypothetical protein VLU25_19575 [Acidobacteriota bacterium]|nr:hypothetical protein [Acidobacteriota bacterium]